MFSIVGVQSDMLIIGVRTPRVDEFWTSPVVLTFLLFFVSAGEESASHPTSLFACQKGVLQVLRDDVNAWNDKKIQIFYSRQVFDDEVIFWPKKWKF